MKKIYDVAVIGGGINGCGVAADAATRGLSVFLCEQDDLASKTSSSSTKLIHGGLRYLEHFDFKMVKKALNERQKLLQLAPHLVIPLTLILPHVKKMRPLWVLKIGLLIYDYLSYSNLLPKSRLVTRKKFPTYFKPLKPTLKKGFRYYDCSTNDSKLTIANAIQAREYGAEICPRTSLINAEINDNLWHLTLQKETGETYLIVAKSIINATGPWVQKTNQILHIPQQHKMALVKGSHLIVDKLFEGEHAYFLQHDDERLVFVIPYFGHTMIGTTDVEINDLDNIQVSDQEIDYLLSLVNKYFKVQINRSHIKDQWCGVRPLLHETDKQAKSLSRDYTYEYSQNPAPAIAIYGGKITTYRQLSADVVDGLKTVFPDLKKSITDELPLPGAKLGAQTLKSYEDQAKETYSWISHALLKRYLSQYGTRTQLILNGKQTMSDLGIRFSSDFYQAELDYLIEYEWAKTMEDILYRRTRLGLSIDDISRQKIKKYLHQHPKINHSNAV